MGQPPLLKFKCKNVLVHSCLSSERKLWIWIFMKFLVDLCSYSLQENVCTDFIVRSWNKFPQKADFRSVYFVIDRLFMKLLGLTTWILSDNVSNLIADLHSVSGVNRAANFESIQCKLYKLVVLWLDWCILFVSEVSFFFDSIFNILFNLSTTCWWITSYH